MSKQIKRLPKTRSFTLLAAALVLVLMLPLGVVSLGYAQYALEKLTLANSDFIPLTKTTAQEIADGKLRYPDGRVDPLLYGKAPLDPEADDDGDSLKNRDEIGTKVENGKTLLVYKTHPRMKDTDGDGIADAQDTHPLRWDLSPRDAILFMKLAYRNDSEIDALLNPNLTLDEIGNQQSRIKSENIWRYGFANMHNDLSPYWQRVKTWRNDNGFDAQLYEFTNKTLPFLEPSSVHMVAFRGTAGGEDLDDDTRLGTGLWPGQADSAVAVADEIYQAGYKNVYATGHSLGGFLTQIFMVRSLGERFNLGYDADKNKHDNKNLVRGYTFNAPRIKCVAPLLNRWMCDYEKRGIQLSQLRLSTHYVTENDPVANIAGRFENAIVLKASANGHSSTSFFEAQYDNQWGFTFPTRPSLSQENQPLVDPALFEPRPVTTIDFKRYDTGEKIFSRSYALSEKEAKAFNINAEVNSYNAAKQSGWLSGARIMNLKRGESNEVSLIPNQFTLKYSFTLADKEIASVSVGVRYLDDYTVPTVPAHSDPRKKYLPTQEIPKLEPAEIVSSRLFTIPVKEVETTSIEFLDPEGRSLKTIDIESDTADKTPLQIKDTDLPPGYVLPKPMPEIRKAQHNQIQLQKRVYQVKYRFMAKDTLVEEKLVSAPYQEEAALPELPEGYELVSGSAVSSVEKDQSVAIQVAKKRFRIQVTFTGSPAPASEVMVAYNESMSALPPLPEGYVLAGEMPELPRAVKSDGELVVPVKLAEFTLRYRYLAGGELVKEDREVVAWGKDSTYQLQLPEGYLLAADTKLPVLKQVKASQEVDLACVKATFPVTLKYVHQGKVVAEQTQEIEYGANPVFAAPPHSRPNSEYQIAATFTWKKKITAAQTIEIPLVEKIPATVLNPQAAKTTYQVKIEYTYQQKLVKSETQKVLRGNKAVIVSPSPSYLIAGSFKNPEISSSRKLVVPLELKQVPVEKDRFNDIATYPFRKEINWLADKNITTGYSDGGFHPHESVSRAAMAAFLYRYSGSPSYSAPAQSPFTDITPNTPFYREICWLATTGITTGYKDGSFRPWAAINRDAMAAFLKRYDANVAKLKLPLKHPGIDFTDTATNPFNSHILWLSQTGITTGYDDGTYRPLQSIERGAIATFFYRMEINRK